jgi:hypothetical protein
MAKLDLNIDIENLTRDQMIVIKKLAFMAEGYLDYLADVVYDAEDDPHGEHKARLRADAQECADLWDRLRKELRMHKRDLAA